MTDLREAVRQDRERAEELVRKREAHRARLDGIEEGRAEEADQDVGVLPAKAARFVVVGYRTNDENEEPERHETPWANVASSYLWGMLRRGYVQVLVEGIGTDGRVAYGRRR